MAFTPRTRLVTLGALALAATVAHADLTVNQALGTLGYGTTALSGTTVGGADNASYYSNANSTLFWDAEYVYSFSVTQKSRIDISGLSNAAGNDNDAFLLNSLTTTPGAGGRPVGSAVGALVETSGGLGVVEAGTYYLSIDAFRETTGVPSPGSAFNASLIVGDWIPTGIDSQVGGSSTATLAAGQVLFYQFDYTGGALSFDTEGTTLSGTNDTELGLYDSAGVLVDLDDDSGTGNLSLLSFADGELAAGQYYLAVGAFNTVFEGDFLASSGSTQTGSLVVNGLSPASPVPEPASMAALGVGALALLRRRSRRK